jgi:hypothetical protein
MKENHQFGVVTYAAIENMSTDFCENDGPAKPTGSGFKTMHFRWVVAEVLHMFALQGVFEVNLLVDGWTASKHADTNMWSMAERPKEQERNERKKKADFWATKKWVAPSPRLTGYHSLLSNLSSHLPLIAAQQYPLLWQISVGIVTPSRPPRVPTSSISVSNLLEYLGEVFRRLMAATGVNIQKKKMIGNVLPETNQIAPTPEIHDEKRCTSVLQPVFVLLGVGRGSMDNHPILHIVNCGGRCVIC